MEKISVAVRFRPSIAQELPGERQWRVEDNRITLHRPFGTPVSGVSFAFDHVFVEGCTNGAVYEVLIKSIIESAVNGFNGTAFAYGQTSSGKTYTMNGCDNDSGIIQLAVNDVFNNIDMVKEREFLIRVSYMEIYNEEINDLLSLENQKLQIHESLERGIYVAGLREEIVNSADQVFKLLTHGEANRHFGETNMNVRSSRSHTIFRMVIESSSKDTSSSGDLSNADAIRVSVLNLVDLAGSERIAKTGAGGVRLKEGKHINKSLMALGNVINKLSDSGKQRAHIPYRDSKLTRILQPALGGNAKTSIICTVAPEEMHVEETRGTLQFASRAKRITNCAQVNEILTDAALLKRQKLEIEELRRKLQGSHSEVLEQMILKQRNDMLKSELEREKLAIQLEDERKSREALEHYIKEQQLKIDTLNSLSSFSDHARNSAEETLSARQSSMGTCNEHDSTFGIESFRTPNLKAMPNKFVAKRSNYSALPDSSPMPESFGNVADEDVWMQLNKGCRTDLNMLQISPNMEPQSLPSRNISLVTWSALEEGRESAGEGCITSEGEAECGVDKKILEATMEKCATLERECNLLREEKSSLAQAVSTSEETVKLLTAQKEELLNELKAEKQEMKDLKEEIRLFGLSFAQREGILKSLHTKSKALVQNLKSHPVVVPGALEC